MNMDTHNAIMAYRDQFITEPHGCPLRIAMLADNKEDIKAVIDIARAAGHKVTKRIIGKGDSDAEVHLTIN
jgi:hypothetical protein